MRNCQRPTKSWDWQTQAILSESIRPVGVKSPPDCPSVRHLCHRFAGARDDDERASCLELAQELRQAGFAIRTPYFV